MADYYLTFLNPLTPGAGDQTLVGTLSDERIRFRPMPVSALTADGPQPIKGPAAVMSQIVRAIYNEGSMAGIGMRGIHLGLKAPTPGS